MVFLVKHERVTMIKDFILSILSYFEALIFAIRHGLLRYFLLSGILGLLIWVAIFLIVKFSSVSLFGLVEGFLPEWLLFGTMPWLIGIALMVVFYIIFKYIYMIILSPFMGPLANRVAQIKSEGQNIQEESRVQFVRDIVRSSYLALRNIVREIFYTILLLLASLIPGVAIISPFLIIAVQSYYAGFGNMDYYMEGRYSSKESVSLVSDNKGIAIGNGLPFVFMILIPIIGVGIALPLATIAGTLTMVKKGY